jgi:hypothetical protein
MYRWPLLLFDPLLPTPFYEDMGIVLPLLQTFQIGKSLVEILQEAVSAGEMGYAQHEIEGAQLKLMPV